MPVYMVIETKSSDPVTYAKYIEKVKPIVEKFQGRYLARGGKVTPLFGNWDPERLILIEFPSQRQVTEWLSSREYREISGLRESSVSTKAVIIEGCAEGSFAQKNGGAMDSKKVCVVNLVLKGLGILMLLAAAFDVTAVSDNVMIFWALACFVVASVIKRIAKGTSCCK